MSYNCYGFGVAITEQNIVPKSTQAILDLLAMAPSDYCESCIRDLAEYAKYELEEGQTLAQLSVNQVLEVLNENEPQCCKGIAPILAAVIHKTENIEMAAVCDDYTSKEYLVYIRKYPWNMSRAECDMTDITLTDIIAEYIAVISDVEPIVKEQNWQWCD